ncbi:unnamed protein product [Didymodactylos carnosus]|uniref:G domain-containing protein n=1 Tax=Didymodactylos carnosus TaxID=1234261 RepID=A0A815KBH0_9BILA|nr:unnamed protein product [Didymodactylos carnosus]CAF4285263.1 unnamed protein product [Didymodactylos carnosus]
MSKSVLVPECKPPEEDVIDITPALQEQLNERMNALASTYTAYKSQIELSGEKYTLDPAVRSKLFAEFDEFNIIICGAPRVGKSTLINTLCDRKVARTHPSIMYNKLTRSFLKERRKIDDSEIIEYIYNFWDTPGFESWSKNDIQAKVNRTINKPKCAILCVICCASPGSFAVTKQLDWILIFCIVKHIFCALVVSNPWAGSEEQCTAVLEKFRELLSVHHKQTIQNMISGLCDG